MEKRNLIKYLYMQYTRDIGHPLSTHSVAPNAPTRSRAFLSSSFSSSSSVFARVLASSSFLTGVPRPDPFLPVVTMGIAGCGGLM